jgi:hypothetical protein
MRIRRFIAAALAAAGITLAVTASPASASAAASSHLDRAACAAVYHYHHVNAVPALYADEGVWQSAYSAAMTDALKAGPEVSGVIVHYLREGDQWSWVRAACR